MDNLSANPATLQRVCKNVRKQYSWFIDEHSGHFEHKL